MSVVTPVVAAWVLRSLAAALLLVEHAVLARRAWRSGARGLALLAPWWSRWCAGERAGPIRYGLYAGVYGALAQV